MRRFLIAFFFFITVYIYSSNIALTVLDFEVQSNNDKHEYLGKGFAEFLSFDLSREKQITLIERDKRNDIIDELKFGLSGLADESSLAELGMMLQSDYIIAGEIFDMGEILVVSSRLIDLESGVVEAQAQAEGSMAEYKSITQSLTLQILDSLKITDVVLPEIKSSEDDEVVLTTFSEAVDAYDEGNDDLAREKLDEATKIDSNNKAVKKLANKLNVISPKFQFEDPLWHAPYNPALSSMLDSGLLYVRSTFYSYFPFFSGVEPDGLIISVGDELDSRDFALKDESFNSHIGYNFPIGKRIGINTEIVVAAPDTNVAALKKDRDIPGVGYLRDIPVIIDGEQVFEGAELQPTAVDIGFTAGLSYRITDFSSIGLNGSIFIPLHGDIGDGGNIISASTDDDDPAEGPNVSSTDGLVYELSNNIGYLINPGFISYFFDKKLFFDINIAYLILDRHFYDYDQDAYVTGTFPIYVSSSLNGTIIENILFFGLKSNFDIYKDEEAKGIYIKETPVLEIWPTRYFSFRGGYSFSYFNIDGRESSGHGYLGGASIKLGALEADLNLAKRLAPLDSVEGALIPSYTVFFNISFNDFWPKRRN
jgi:TolB-like protein